MTSFSSFYKIILTSRDETYRYYLIKKYLQEHDDEDRIQFIRIILGLKQLPIVSLKKLTSWCMEYKEIPEWLLKKSHATVGDWIETLSLVLAKPENQSSNQDSLSTFINKINLFKDQNLKESFIREWESTPADELFLMHKILTGSLKPLIKKQALALLLNEIHKTELSLLHHRLNELSDKEMDYSALTNPTWTPEEVQSKPYLFVYPEIIDRQLFHLGDPDQWIVEPFIHGIRVQIYRSLNSLKIINTDHEIFSIDKSPAHAALMLLPPETVLEVVFSNDTLTTHHVIDFHRWHTLEKYETNSLTSRRETIQIWLDSLGTTFLKLIPQHNYSQWKKNPDYLGTDGWMIKGIQNDLPWYRLKPPPIELNTALMYVEYINQSSAIQYNITLGVLDLESQLVPIAKVSCDLLNDSDKNELHYWIQNNTAQRFGPVRLVRAGKFIAISYDRAQLNKRVKCGLTLLNIRIIKIGAVSNQSKPISSIIEVSV